MCAHFAILLTHPCRFPFGLGCHGVLRLARLVIQQKNLPPPQLASCLRDERLCFRGTTHVHSTSRDVKSLQVCADTVVHDGYGQCILWTPNARLTIPPTDISGYGLISVQENSSEVSSPLRDYGAGLSKTSMRSLFIRALMLRPLHCRCKIWSMSFKCLETLYSYDMQESRGSVKKFCKPVIR